MCIIGRLVWCLADVYRSTYVFFLHEEQQFKKKSHINGIYLKKNTVNFLLKHDLYQKGFVKTIGVNFEIVPE